MFPGRHPPPQGSGPSFKFTVGDSCDRIKQEFSYLQAQCEGLKADYEKLVGEKTEIQRHYVMVRALSSARGYFVVVFVFLASTLRVRVRSHVVLSLI
jgi:prefoldin subunit 5